MIQASIMDELKGRVRGGYTEQRRASRFISIKMVEAGGVEPPSEKRYAAEPTCLSQFRRTSLARGALSPAALRTSKKRGRLVR